MPYDWHSENGTEVLRAWPYRSLPRRGFVWFIGITAAMITLPMLAVIGTTALWGLLPFTALAVWGIWFALQRSYRTGETSEELRFDRNRLYLRRQDRGRPDRIWETNTYWLRPVLRKGPVEDYLTLTDGKREVELGAFLTPEERRALRDEVLARLAQVR